MSDWFSRVGLFFPLDCVDCIGTNDSQPEEFSPMVLVKKPNPRNQQNAAKLHELELEAKRYETCCNFSN